MNTAPPTSAAQLDVFFEDEQVGSIHDSTPLSFNYSDAWLARPAPAQIAAIAPAKGPINGEAVTAFFENLLPEGDLRHFIASSKKASSLFALLREVAGDTVGGFVILPAGQRPAQPTYHPTTWQALATLIGQSSAAAIDMQGEQTRISLSGAQDKAAIALFEHGTPQLPQGTSPSTHIRKPNIRRLAKVWHSAPCGRHGQADSWRHGCGARSSAARAATRRKNPGASRADLCTENDATASAANRVGVVQHEVTPTVLAIQISYFFYSCTCIFHEG